MTRLAMTALLLLATVDAAVAQNVSGYGLIPDPLLFLLREPEVHQDLALTDAQRKRLVALNESFDGSLLASRNVPQEQSQQQVQAVMQRTRDAVAKLLTAEQIERLQQIAYRLRGVSCVLIPAAAEELELTGKQRQEVEAIVKETLEAIREAQTGTYQGEQAQQELQQKVTAARRSEQQRILAQLDDQQKQKLVALLGRRFDSLQLGRVSFRAPDLAEGDQWINSEPLKLNSLRGKVVALHFWAFG